MEDQENNLTPEQPNETPRNPREDIPLWLQGIEEETKTNRLRSAQKEESPPIENEAEESPPFEFPLDITNAPETPAEEIETTEEPAEEEEISSPDEPDLSDSFTEVEESPVSGGEELEEEVLSEIEEIPEASLSSEPSIEDLDSSEQPFVELGEDEEGTTPAEEETSKIAPPPEPAFEIPESSEFSYEEEKEEVEEVEEFEEILEEEDEDTEEVTVPPASDQAPENVSPEWVNEITDLTTEPEDIQEEHTKPQVVAEREFYFADDEPEDLSSEPTQQPGELFIDISEAEIEGDSELPSDEEGAKAFNEEPDFSPDEILPDDEELPKWLQRLISESYPDYSPAEPQAIDEDDWDETTKPVQVTPSDSLIAELDEIGDLEEIEDFDLVEGLEAIHFEEESLEEEPPIETDLEDQETGPVSIPPEEDYQESEEFTDTLPADEDTLSPETEEESLEEGTPIETDLEDQETGPVSIPPEEDYQDSEEFTDTLPADEDVLPPETKEPIEWSEEDNHYVNHENGYVVDIPEPLLFARQVLQHGETAQALEVFRAYIAEADYLDEIKVWLLEAAESRMDCLSEIWESIGDIAANQGNHQGALAAYSKAINYLLVYKDEHGTC